MYCSCEKVACFLCLLIILKWTLDYFYDGSKQNESRTGSQIMQRFDSFREKDFNLQFCTRNRNNIQTIESDCRSIIQGLWASSWPGPILFGNLIMKYFAVTMSITQLPVYTTYWRSQQTSSFNILHQFCLQNQKVCLEKITQHKNYLCCLKILDFIPHLHFTVKFSPKWSFLIEVF